MEYGMIRTPTVCFVTVLMVGCAHGVVVQVTGTQKNATPIPVHVTYAVLPTEEVEKDRTFPRYAKMVAKKLDDRGYRETDAKVARLGVFLAYAVTEGSVTASDTSSFGAIGTQSGVVGSGGGMPGAGTAGGGGSYGTMPSSPGSASLPVYTTQVVIVVADYEQSRSTGNLVELWRGETLTTGRSNDLPRMIPILIEAAFRHFGETTSKDLEQTFQDDDENITTLRAVK